MERNIIEALSPPGGSVVTSILVLQREGNAVVLSYLHENALLFYCSEREKKKVPLCNKAVIHNNLSLMNQRINPINRIVNVNDTTE